MSAWLFVLDALDGAGTPKTLFYSDTGIVVDGDYYDARIAKPALLQVYPVTGGLYAHIFPTGGAGDIELSNADGGLDFLDDYAVDGQSAVVKFLDDDGSLIEMFNGTAQAISDDNDRKRIKLIPRSEALKKDHPFDVYLGDNVLPAGLEGTEGDLKDGVKPKLWGDVRNIPAKLVNQSLLIYQVSSLADCTITSVYDDGVKLVNYRTNGAHSLGATSIAITGGLGPIKAGDKVMFSNHPGTVYTVATGLSAGVIVLSSGLTLDVPNKTDMEQVDYYADTTALQATNYLVDGAHVVGATDIAVDSGVGAINAGDVVVFGSQNSAYTVATGLSAGHIVLTDGLDAALSGGEQVIVLGEEMPSHWASFNGYFRLSAPPAGLVTCDARTVLVLAGDVFSAIVGEASITVDSASVTLLNGVGVVGLYADQKITTFALLDKLIAGLGAYYYFIGSTLYAGLLNAPAVSASASFQDYQIASVERSALGMGANGVPQKGINIKYDRIETTQTTTAGAANNAFKERLKSQYRSYEANAATIHALAEIQPVESLLRFRTGTVILASRLLNLASVRRDVVSASLIVKSLGSIQIGDTIELVSSKLGYSAGRKFKVIGFELNAKKKIYDVRLLG